MPNEANERATYLEVIDIQAIGKGMRVCLDFVDILHPDAGLFLGNTGHGYIKVLSENRPSADYPARPFRMNCGAFHHYLYQGGSTKYLHEINPGEKLFISVFGEDALPLADENKLGVEDFDASQELEIPVGRVKIERRPLMRVVCKKTTSDERISATLQKASSVTLSEENKGAISILDLKVGDNILCIEDHPGRHLGEKIDEVIIEK